MREPYDIETLARVDRQLLWGLLHERATPVWKQVHPHAFDQKTYTWWAVLDVLAAATRGERPTNRRPSPPRWLAGLARDQLAWQAREWSSNGQHFLDVRALERLGLVTLEVDEDYVLAMVGHTYERDTPTDLSGIFRTDPDLRRRALWRVFEVEGGGQVSLANTDRANGRFTTWTDAFNQLAADGTIDRDQVLRSCLRALGRDFSAYRAGWYSRTYDSFTAPVSEVAGHQDDLVHLLRATVPSTASWGLRHLVAVDKAGLLDDDALVAHVGAVLLHPAKATASSGLRLLARIAGRRPDLRSAVLQTVQSAQQHPHRDVRTAAAVVATGLGAAPEPAPDEPLPTHPHPDATVAVASPIVAVSEADLLERVAALMEDASDPIEVELVLSALSCLHDPAVLAPLRKRARAVHRNSLEWSGHGLIRWDIARLVLLGLGEEPDDASGVHGRPGLEFLIRRLEEVGQALTGARNRAPLLATPTHRDGWLNPATLVDRVLAAQGAPWHHDLVAALLRLSPDGRSAALTAAADLGGELGQVLRYALGAAPPELPPCPDCGGPQLPTPAWWIAAARSRAPLEPDQLLLAAGWTGAGDGQPVDADVEVVSTQPGFRAGMHLPTILHIQHESPALVMDAPTRARWLGRQGAGGGVAQELVAWSAMIWPHDAERVLVDLVDEVLMAVQEKNGYPSAVLTLQMLAHHPGHTGRLAAITVAAALSGSLLEQRVAATDAVLALVPTGRISATDLASAMDHLQAFCVATRWSASLTDVAAASTSGRRATVDVLTALLPTLTLGLRGLNSLVELLHTTIVSTGGHVTDPELRRWCEQQTGSSRTTRAARALLALDPGEPA